MRNRNIARGRDWVPRKKGICEILRVTNLIGFDSVSAGKRIINLTISSVTANYNIFTNAGSPSDPVIVNLTINNYVYGTSNGAAALQTGTGWANTSVINITNNSYVFGCGGNGAAAYYNAGGAAGAGGPAMSIDSGNVTVNITNGSGYIYGGGGGGGYGGSAYTSDIPDGYNDYAYAPGGSGGGGQSYQATSGGGTPTGGNAYGGSYGASFVNGGAGAKGGSGGPGGGGAAGGCYTNWTTAAGSGAGGTGGAWGSAGSAGSVSSFVPSYGGVGSYVIYYGSQLTANTTYSASTIGQLARRSSA